MSDNALNSNFASGDTILDAHIKQLIQALNGDLVGREGGVATPGQSLGNPVIPWGRGYFESLIIAGQNVDFSQISSPPDRIASGQSSALSGAGRFISIDGSTATILGNTTPLNLVANGRTFSIDSDVDIQNITLGFFGPDTIRETTLAKLPASGDPLRFGELDYAIGNQRLELAASVSEIASRIGQKAAFKIGDELVYAHIQSATEIRPVSRQFFLGPGNTRPARTSYKDTTVVEILRTGWIFADAASPENPEITYIYPVESTKAPGNPATGQYWYDLRINRWRRYNGADWISVERIPIAIVCSDLTGLVGFRCLDFYKRNASLNELEWERISDSKYQTSKQGRVAVFGNVLNIPRFFEFNASTDVEAGVVVQGKARFHTYLTERGELRASNLRPVWRPDLGGYYHPYKNWIAVLDIYNNSSDSTELVDANNWFPFEKYSTKIKLLKKWVVSVNSAGTLQKRDSKSEKHPVLSSSRSGSGAGARYALVWRTGFFTEGPAVSGESSSGHGNLGYSSLASLTTSGWSGIIPYQAGSSGGPQDFVVELSAMGAQAEQIDIENSLL